MGNVRRKIRIEMKFICNRTIIVQQEMSVLLLVAGIATEAGAHEGTRVLHCVGEKLLQVYISRIIV